MHRAGAPTLIPVPSLLRSLLSEHLDPGYAAAAAQRSAGGQPKSRLVAAIWQVLAALAIATVFAFAVAHAQATAPGVPASQQVLPGTVRPAPEALAVPFALEPREPREDVRAGVHIGAIAFGGRVGRAAAAMGAIGAELARFRPGWRTRRSGRLFGAESLDELLRETEALEA